jgi:hypothetical protein
MTPLRLIPAKLRALAWALHAVLVARRQLAHGRFDSLILPPVPRLPSEAKGAVQLALRLGSRNCLVQSAIRQAWYAAHGRAVDLVIGVTAPGEGFRAHAWLESDPPAAGDGYEELARRPAQASQR